MLAAAARLTIVLLQAQAQGAAGDPSTFFEEKVRPLLASRCFGCHGETAVSRLRLDSRSGVLKGGRRGPAVIPSDAGASLLVRAIERSGELKMPPEGRLPDADIATLRDWIQAGAQWPAAAQVLATSTGRITAEQRNWWAFRPLAPNAAARGGIDNFVAAKMAENGVKPAPMADRRTLIRRLAFDLTGLPPTPAEAQAFIADGNTAAAVDRFLSSPRFGERWARYWLDIARFGEDDFRGLDQEKYPNAWRYRDWVIDAFNRDLPYATFVKAQLAADLMEGDASFDLRPALGFLGLGPWHYAISPPPQARADERHDRIDVVTRGFLGLTVACARCHDHKFDPITMRDYYGLGGVFASTAYREFPLTGQEAVDRYEAHQQKIKGAEGKVAEFLKQQKEQLGAMLAAQSGRYIAAVRAGGDAGLNGQVFERWKALLAKPEREHKLLDGWREGDDSPARMQELILSVIAEKRELDEEKRIALERSKPTRGAKTRLPNGFETYDDFCPGCDVSVRAQPRERFKLWEDLYREAPKDKPSAAGGVLAFSDAEIEAQLSGEWKRHLDFLRAEVAALKKSAPPAYPFLHAAGDKPEAANLKLALKGDPYRLGEETPRRFLEVLSPEQPRAWTSGSGRLELAEAIVAQPLAARVAVNRIWMKMMGRALVGSPSNFGRYGERPSHPELLEYLAARFAAGGGSTKKLIREIALSAAYQRSSETMAANEAIDAANKWFWRANRERLDAEALRDSLLAAAGTLDAQAGGASEELTAEHHRRTVYGRVSRFKLNETLQLFDFPSPATTSEKRNITHVPLQRLFFLNGELVARQAAALAARIEREAGPAAGVDKQLDHAYSLLFQRAPSAEERRLNTEFLAAAGWKQLAQVLLSSNEFLFVD